MTNLTVPTYKKKPVQSEVHYDYRGQALGKVPFPLKPIVEIIKKSESILKLEDNWDTLGGKSFSEDTWKAAAIFLINYSNEVNDFHGFVIDTPNIYPGPNGSIDIDWETTKYGLIVNIAEGGETATYYADNRDNKNRQMTEGLFNPHKFHVQLLPLAIPI
jgi:hypothetical protein